MSQQARDLASGRVPAVQIERCKIMQRVFGALLIAATCAASLASGSARADDRRSGPFQLLPTVQVAGDGATSVDVTPVQWGWGGYSRQYYRGGYSGGYYQSPSYYGGYQYPAYSYSYPAYSYSYPSYGYSYPSYGYSYPSYGYQPYSSAYRGW
jgi:hypothetical protein